MEVTLQYRVTKAVSMSKNNDDTYGEMYLGGSTTLTRKIVLKPLKRIEDGHKLYGSIRNVYFLKAIAIDPINKMMILLSYDTTLEDWLINNATNGRSGANMIKITGTVGDYYFQADPNYLFIIRCLVKGLQKLHREGMCIQDSFSTVDIVVVNGNPNYKAVRVEAKSKAGVKKDYANLVLIIRNELFKGKTLPDDLEDFF